MSLACPICYEEYSTQRPARILRNCGHDLCDQCIRQALGCKSRGLLRCPTCRAPLLIGEKSSDYMRILNTSRSSAGRTFFRSLTDAGDRPCPSVADLLMEELFPKSVALTHINSRMEVTALHKQEVMLRNCETDMIITELRQRMSLADICKSEASSVTESRHVSPRNSESDDVAKLEDVVTRVAKNLRSGWKSVEASPHSYADGLEDLSWSMIWLFILWLFQATAAIYKYVICAPFRYWSQCQPDERVQILALAQGVPLLVGACYICLTMFS